MDTLKKLFWISRPISWPNTSYPFIAGVIVAAVLLPAELSLLTAIVGTLYFLGPYNLLMYGVNDVFDYESDIKNPRKGGVEGMKESRAFHSTILRAVVITNVPFLLYLFIVSDWTARLVLALVVFSAIAYSLKGLRFKEIPILDSLTSSFHFVGPLLYALTLVGLPEGSWAWLLAFFLWGMASHAFGAVQDIIPDREGKLHSIATALGARVTIWASIAAYAGAVVVALSQGSAYLAVAVMGAAYIVNLLPYLKVTDATSASTNKAWRRFLWLNYASGAVITLTLILTLAY